MDDAAGRLVKVKRSSHGAWLVAYFEGADQARGPVTQENVQLAKTKGINLGSGLAERGTVPGRGAAKEDAGNAGEERG